MWRVFLMGQQPRLRASLAQTIEDQGEGTLQIVGETCGEPDDLEALRSAKPHVVVLVLGFEPSHGLWAIPAIRRTCPGCRVVGIDTLGGALGVSLAPWGQADLLLRTEQLATELVPAIRRLVAQGRAATSEPGDERVSPTILE
jgi:DNA-binding NarL/FixJ family response regulator